MWVRDPKDAAAPLRDSIVRLGPPLVVHLFLPIAPRSACVRHLRRVAVGSFSLGSVEGAACVSRRFLLTPVCGGRVPQTPSAPSGSYALILISRERRGNPVNINDLDFLRKKIRVPRAQKEKRLEILESAS